MLVYQPANRIAGIERLKQMRLYASYYWDALLALKVKAPLASYFEEQVSKTYLLTCLLTYLLTQSQGAPGLLL